MRGFVLAVLILLISLTGCDGGASTYRPTAAALSTPINALPISATATYAPNLPTPISDALIAAADAEYLLLSNLYERTIPSVVNIEVVTADGTTDGSGFLYDRDGHLITNAHVVNGANEIRVTFHDGYVKTGVLVGVDTFSDLAVIRVDQVDAARLIPLPLGDSNQVRVGERAIAIGNPFGLASSMTLGIVSALGRNLSSAELIDPDGAVRGFQNPAIIQVDAQINPGNSGGPLLNSRGEVIGVNTAIRSASGVFEGVGFAVPINTVKRVAPELIATGRVEYAWLGIQSLNNENGYGVAGLAELLDLPVTSGVMISEITPDSPADKAGLRGGTHPVDVRGVSVCMGGDIIVAINGVYVGSLDQLVAYLVMNSKPNDTITLRIVRGQETFDLPVLLEARPVNPAPSRCGER
ncbi:MAG: trypsin-like peptidase domain-containing protein [Anaerolineae bacterium]|jgi:2-alkenal reductase|nr:trypsin-like peptidase domain-containing protein [Anaerolineae bacterium]